MDVPPPDISALTNDISSMLQEAQSSHVLASAPSLHLPPAVPADVTDSTTPNKSEGNAPATSDHAPALASPAGAAVATIDTGTVPASSSTGTGEPATDAHRYHLTPLSIPGPAPSANSPMVGSPLKRRLSFTEDTTTAAAVPAVPGSTQEQLLQGTESAVRRAAQNASDWNKLLGWVRRARGPQWDYATATYHVRKNSADYFSGVNRTEGAPIVPPTAGAAGTSVMGLAGGPDASGAESRRSRRARAR
ncbi:hypothetical protein OIV83_006292 [Microbotryomycetes sp. JL201]|nr:hypothetical protein OIV83_006292 [Microbotryomycetes sp. JL201]